MLPGEFPKVTIRVSNPLTGTNYRITDPAFVNTISDYEWVDSAGNYTNYAKLMGWTDGATAGDCHVGSRQPPLTKFRSRCCYDR